MEGIGVGNQELELIMDEENDAHRVQYQPNAGVHPQGQQDEGTGGLGQSEKSLRSLPPSRKASGLMQILNNKISVPEGLRVSPRDVIQQFS